MISEVSEAGLSFVTGHSCNVGEELSIAWRMDDSDEPFHLQCVVRHVNEGRIGVEFMKLSMTERLRLTQWFTRFIARGAPAEAGQGSTQ